MIKIFRQGDVLIIGVAKSRLSKNAKPIARDRGRVVLAYGEASGHAHAILTKDTILFDNGDGVRILAVEGEAELVHEEHATIKLPPGHYEVRRQREYAPAVIRMVAD
jgi:hypothetical protein